MNVVGRIAGSMLLLASVVACQSDTSVEPGETSTASRSAVPSTTPSTFAVPQSSTTTVFPALTTPDVPNEWITGYPCVDEDACASLFASVATGAVFVPKCGSQPCGPYFALDDGNYAYGMVCTRVQDAAVTNETVGTGVINEHEVSVNLIENAQRDWIVAVSNDAGLCGESVDGWVAAFNVATEPSQRAAMLC